MSWIEQVFEAISQFFTDLMEFFLDLPKIIAEGILSGIAFVVNAIPMPDFMSTYVLSDIIPEDIAWVLIRSGFPEALGIISAGIVFYFIRRLVTLGIW